MRFYRDTDFTPYLNKIFRKCDSNAAFGILLGVQTFWEYAGLIGPTAGDPHHTRPVGKFKRAPGGYSSEYMDEVDWEIHGEV